MILFSMNQHYFTTRNHSEKKNPPQIVGCNIVYMRSWQTTWMNSTDFNVDRFHFKFGIILFVIRIYFSKPICHILFSVHFWRAYLGLVKDWLINISFSVTRWSGQKSAQYFVKNAQFGAQCKNTKNVEKLFWFEQIGTLLKSKFWKK